MNPVPRRVAWAAVLALVFGMRTTTGCGNSTPTPPAPRDDRVAGNADLDRWMSRLQRHTDKLGRAIVHRNRPLAQYYLRETRETADAMIHAVPRFNGHAVADSTRSMLMPELHGMQDVLGADDWNAVQAQYRVLLAACNNCHAASGRDFIRITLPSGPSPYNQDFVRPEEGAR